jgi:hypothetical protein
MSVRRVSLLASITNQIKQVKFNQEGLKHGRAN